MLIGHPKSEIIALIRGRRVPVRLMIAIQVALDRIHPALILSGLQVRRPSAASTESVQRAECVE